MKRTLFVILAILLAAPGASAHAVLASSEPAQGQQYTTPPAVVKVTLTEPVDEAAVSLKVLDRDGKRVDNDDLVVRNGDHPLLAMTLHDALPDGPYALEWEALSGADGHHTSGTIGFAVGSFAPPAGRHTDTNKLDPLAAFDKILVFLGLAIALAGVAFAAWIVPRGFPAETARNAVRWGALLHMAGVGFLASHTAKVNHLAFGALWDSDVGRVLLLRLLLAAFAVLAAAQAYRTKGRIARALAGLALLVCAGGSARLGHGSIFGGVAIVLDWIHLVAGALWVGGLVLFAHWLLRGARGSAPDAIRQVGVRFGTLATVCVGVVWSMGLVLTFSLAGSAATHPGFYLDAAWARFVGLKMVLGLAMLGLAFLNRQVFVRGGHGGWKDRVRAKLAPVGDGQGLQRLVAFEAVLGVAVLVLAGLLTSVSPPQASAAPFDGVSIGGSGREYHAQLSLTPRPVVGGRSDLLVQVADHDEVPVENNTCGRVGCLRLDISVAGGAPARYPLEPEGGQWVARDVLWTTAGDGNATLTVSTSDIYEDTMGFAFSVSGAPPAADTSATGA